MADHLTLTGDDNTPALPMTDAEVNHLRRLLAWMRCEWMLDEDMQRGYLKGLKWVAENGEAEKANELLQEQADQISQVPAYVRQAVKMLTKAVRKHDCRSGIVTPEPPR